MVDDSFEAYCVLKNIDSKLFSENEPFIFNEMKALFEQISTNSFTQQKLFLINNWRRKYHLPKPKMGNKA
jgi:hypothetical protein